MGIARSLIVACVSWAVPPGGVYSGFVESIQVAGGESLARQQAVTAAGNGMVIRLCRSQRGSACGSEDDESGLARVEKDRRVGRWVRLDLVRSWRKRKSCATRTTTFAPSLIL